MDPIVPQDVPQKQCRKCKCCYPATSTYFHRNKANHDGFQSHCKTCRSRKAPDVPLPEGMKRCARCKQGFPATREYFSLDRSTRDQWSTRCKFCLSIVHSVSYRRSLIRENPPGEGYLQCSKCKQWKPGTPEFFYRHRTTPRGFQSACKECCSLRRPREWPKGMKRCPRCNQVKSATPEYFYRHQSRHDGLQSYCKGCRDKIQRIHRQ